MTVWSNCAGSTIEATPRESVGSETPRDESPASITSLSSLILAWAFFYYWNLSSSRKAVLLTSAPNLQYPEAETTDCGSALRHNHSEPLASARGAAAQEQQGTDSRD